MTLRIYVTGQRSFGAAVADLVVSEGHCLVGVAAPTFRTAAADEASADPLSIAARRHSVPWTASDRLHPEDVPSGTDVIVSAHSHAFLGSRTRARARLAAVGYHPSLLPLHRGRDAVRWAIRDRDRVTGGSVYHLTQAVDGGPLAAQEHVLIPPGATAQSLWRERLFPLGLRLLRQVFDDLDRGLVVQVPQEESCATWEPSWERPPLTRSGLPAIEGGGGSVRETADPAALYTANAAT